MARKFHDLLIETEMGRGRTGLEDVKSFSEKLGTDTAVICDVETSIEDFSTYIDRIEKLNKESETNIVPGLLLTPGNKRDLKNKVSEYRDRVMVLGVEGGDVEINREASEDSRVDFIADPGRGRKDSGIDHVIARQCSENQVFIVERFRRVLRNQGKERVHALKDIRQHIRFSEKYGAEMIIASGAKEKYGIRSPRDMSSLLETLGTDKDYSLDTVSKNPGKIIERAKKVFSDGYVMPGVEVVDD